VKEKFLIIIDEEKKIYNEIYSLNLTLLNKVKSFEFEEFKKDVLKKDKLINELQNFDKELMNLWRNWEEYKELFSENEKNNIRELKSLMEKNFEIENIIIFEFEKLMEKEKTKNKHIQKGKAAFNAYKTKKVSFPYFVNEKG